MFFVERGRGETSRSRNFGVGRVAVDAPAFSGRLGDWLPFCHRLGALATTSYHRPPTTSAQLRARDVNMVELRHSLSPISQYAAEEARWKRRPG